MVASRSLLRWIPSGAELEIRPNIEDPQDVKSPNKFNGNESPRYVEGVAYIQFLSKQPPLDLDEMELYGGRVQVLRPLDFTKDRRPRYPCTICARNWKIAPGSEIDIPQELIDNGTVRWGFDFKQPDIPADAKISFRIPTEDL